MPPPTSTTVRKSTFHPSDGADPLFGNASSSNKMLLFPLHGIAPPPSRHELTGHQIPPSEHRRRSQHLHEPVPHGSAHGHGGAKTHGHHHHHHHHRDGEKTRRSSVSGGDASRRRNAGGQFKVGRHSLREVEVGNGGRGNARDSEHGSRRSGDHHREHGHGAQERPRREKVVVREYVR
jgi:hypothetical protein